MTAPRVINWLPVDPTLIGHTQVLDSVGVSNNMVLGALTVPTTSVKAGSNLQLSMYNFGTAHGQWYVSNINAGTNFTVNSTNATETSNFAWVIPPAGWVQGISNPLGPGSVFVNAPSVK